jgi:hypothetical protein
MGVFVGLVHGDDSMEMPSRSNWKPMAAMSP